MTNLTHLTIKEALTGLKKKEFTATELTEAHIKATGTHTVGVHLHPDVAVDVTVNVVAQN